MHWTLLAALFLALAWFVRNDLAEYEAFKALARSEERQRLFRRWLVRAFLFFGLGAVAVLLLIGRIEALWRLPPEFEPLSSAIGRHFAHAEGGSGGRFLMIVSAAVLGGSFLGALLAGSGGKDKAGKPALVGDVEPLFPRNPEERRWTALLAINSGPSEELYFRLMLPLILTLATGSAGLAFAVAAMIFGAIHLYQGWIGVLGTMVSGIMLTGLYLASGQIWLPVVLHSLMNLNSLWLRPLIGAWRQGPPAAP